MGEALVLASVADAAAALDHAQAQVRAGEVATLLAIAALCDLHRVDESVLVAGAERWVRGGADGTPQIGEFVVAEIAALLGVSVGAAFDRVAGVLNVRHRHPSLWQGVLAGELRAWEALHVAQACVSAGLEAAACLRFDRLCATALLLQPWQRVRGQVEKWILVADPAGAEARRQAASARRHVSLGGIEDGHISVWGQLDAADGLDLDAALTLVADTLADGSVPDDTAEQRRASALGVMARSVLGQAPLPGTDTARSGRARTAEVIVRLTDTDLHDGVASIDRWGHILLPRLADLLGGCRVTIRPILTASEATAVDGYQVPAAMRRVLDARSPVDVFPFGATPASRCQADHTLPYDHHAPPGAGQTNLGNLGPLATFTHRVKTHGGWRLTQPEPGTYLWRSPLGYEYLVTAAGTLRIGRPPPTEHRWWHVEPPDLEPPEPPESGPLEPVAALFPAA